MRRFKKITALLLSILCLTLVMPASFVMADSAKVITLGADLSEDERQTILNYFGVAGEDIPTLIINNTDEREHLQDYVPLEQIGTRTYSCSYVSPTDDGGIHVKTANLTWVTSNMIAAALSTSGVENCDVIAASPFAVSGTGALTGILMAYESASEEDLDEEKKDASMQELVTTAEIGDDIGQDLATLLVNEAKREILEDDDLTEDDIREIVDDIVSEYSIGLTDEDKQLLEDLLVKLSDLDYDVQAVNETLDLVEENAITNINDDPDINIDIAVSNEDNSDNAVENDSILNSTNDDVFSEDTVFDTTYDTEETSETATTSILEDIKDGVQNIADNLSDLFNGSDSETESNTESDLSDDDDGQIHSIIGDLFDHDESVSENNDTFEDGTEDEESDDMTENEIFDDEETEIILSDDEMQLFSFLDMSEETLEDVLTDIHTASDCTEIVDVEIVSETDGFELILTDEEDNVFYVKLTSDNDLEEICENDAFGTLLYPVEEESEE